MAVVDKIVTGQLGFLCIDETPVKTVVTNNDTDVLAATNVADKTQDKIILIHELGANTNLVGKPRDLFIHYGNEVKLVKGDIVTIINKNYNYPCSTSDVTITENTVPTATQKDGGWGKKSKTGRKEFSMTINGFLERDNEFQRKIIRQFFRSFKGGATGVATVTDPESFISIIALNYLERATGEDLIILAAIQITELPLNFDPENAIEFNLPVEIATIANPCLVEIKRV